MTKFLSKDGKFFMRDGKLLGYIPPVPTASLTPKTGIIYTDGLSSDWNIMKEIGMAISEASDSINANTTESVYVSKGNTWAYKITPGDTISVNNHLYAVMGFNNYQLTNKANYGGNHSYAGLTFGMVDCSEESKMSSTTTNSGGWGECEMRIYTMARLETLIPDAKAQVRIPYYPNSNSGSMLYSDDYMFLPAEKEVFGARRMSPSGEANALTQYAYYKNGRSKIKNYNGSADYWWLRSVYGALNSGYFCAVDIDGGSSGRPAGYTDGVAPCFCV